MNTQGDVTRRQTTVNKINFLSFIKIYRAPFMLTIITWHPGRQYVLKKNKGQQVNKSPPGRGIDAAVLRTGWEAWFCFSREGLFSIWTFRGWPFKDGPGKTRLVSSGLSVFSPAVPINVRPTGGETARGSPASAAENRTGAKAISIWDNLQFIQHHRPKTSAKTTAKIKVLPECSPSLSVLHYSILIKNNAYNCETCFTQPV